MDLSSTYSWRHSTMRAHGTKAVARHCLHGVAGGPSMTRGTTGPPVMDGGSSTLVGRGHGWGSSYSGAPGSSRARPGCPSPTDKHRGALPPTARCGRGGPLPRGAGPPGCDPERRAAPLLQSQGGAPPSCRRSSTVRTGDEPRQQPPVELLCQGTSSTGRRRPLFPSLVIFVMLQLCFFMF
jgi:hypothetical protein